MKISHFQLIKPKGPKPNIGIIIFPDIHVHGNHISKIVLSVIYQIRNMRSTMIRSLEP